MKRLLMIPMFAAVAMFQSCDKQTECESCDSGSEEKSLVNVSIQSSATRAYDVTDAQEKNIESCRIYVFKIDESKETFVNSYDVDLTTSRAGFYLAKGTYSFYAIANAESYPLKPASSSALLSDKVNLIDNSVNSFVMKGSDTERSIQGDTEIPIVLKRLVNKYTFVVRNSSKDNEDVQIDSVYLTNVVGTYNLGLSGAISSDTLWYNKMNYAASDADDLIFAGADNLGQILKVGEELTTKHSFYAFPNPTVDDSRAISEWSARHTRFVVKARFDGTTYYYPVTMATQTVGNVHYTIDITITGPGVDHPEDDPTGKAFIKVTVTVADWDEAEPIEQTF